MSNIQIQDSPDALVVTASHGSAGAVGCLVPWLIFWAFGLVCLAIGDRSLEAIGVLAAPALVGLFLLGLIVYSVAGKDRLIVGPEGITWEREAVVTFDRRTIGRDKLRALEVKHALPQGKRRGREHWRLVIHGEDFDIRFGESLDKAELEGLLARVRARLAADGVEPGSRDTDADRADADAADANDADAGSRRRAGRRELKLKMPYEAILFGLVVGVSLVVRFSTLPPDAGGLFFQVWIAAVGLSVLAALPPYLKPWPRAVVSLVLVPDLMLLVWGSTLFAPQLLFPFMFLGGVIGAACYFWSASRRPPALLFALAAVPLSVGVWAYAVPHMRTLQHLRTLGPGELREVRIEDERNKTALVIDDRATLRAIAEQLADTSPYSPNHEGIAQPQRMTLRLDDGSTIDCKIGKGNRVNPDTVWIAFGVEDYQNASLYPTLRAQGVFDKPAPAAPPDKAK
ncbi:MAG: hypothetical protein GC159_11830 [Phycisphaera sp.]|nr:hypothetical protein [Phycisphaera sp.]